MQRYDGDQVTVLFDEHGYRELYLPVVLRTRPPATRPAGAPGPRARDGTVVTAG